MQRWRFSFPIRRLIVAGMLVCVALGAKGCQRQRDNPYWARSGQTGMGFGYSFKAMWHIAPEPDEVMHIVFFPWGASISSFGTTGLGHPPSPEGITSHPDGLYIDGKRVPRGEGRRVFVVTKDRKMRPIPLSDEELKALDPARIDKIDTTEVWTTKIRPVLWEEAWQEGDPDKKRLLRGEELPGGEPTYINRGGKVAGYEFRGWWHVAPEPDEVIYILFFPYGADIKIDGGTKKRGRRVPSPKAISIFDGKLLTDPKLFADGVRVPLGKGRRVFVYTEERTLRPIPLTDEELQALDPEAVDHKERETDPPPDLETTEVWKTKILPVLKEESWGYF